MRVNMPSMRCVRGKDSWYIYISVPYVYICIIVLLMNMIFHGDHFLFYYTRYRIISLVSNHMAQNVTSLHFYLNMILLFSSTPPISHTSPHRRSTFFHLTSSTILANTCANIHQATFNNRIPLRFDNELLIITSVSPPIAIPRYLLHGNLNIYARVDQAMTTEIQRTLSL